MSQYNELEKHALEVAACKQAEKEASAKVVRIKNDLMAAEKEYAEAKRALDQSRETFVRKVS